MPLDGDELVQGVGQVAGLVLEAGQVGQVERRLLGLRVAGEVVGDVLHRLQPPRLEAVQQVGCDGPVGANSSFPLGGGRGVAPGGVGVLQRDRLLKRERLVYQLLPGSPESSARRACPGVEQPGPEELAERRALVPVELQVGGHRLERLADHRVVLRSRISWSRKVATGESKAAIWVRKS